MLSFSSLYLLSNWSKTLFFSFKISILWECSFLNLISFSYANFCSLSSVCILIKASSVFFISFQLNFLDFLNFLLSIHYIILLIFYIILLLNFVLLMGYFLFSLIMTFEYFLYFYYWICIICFFIIFCIW